eukprot:6171387-Pyramimonas_sp.AAC.1
MSALAVPRVLCVGKGGVGPTLHNYHRGSAFERSAREQPFSVRLLFTPRDKIARQCARQITNHAKLLHAGRSVRSVRVS